MDFLNKADAKVTTFSHCRVHLTNSYLVLYTGYCDFIGSVLYKYLLKSIIIFINANLNPLPASEAYMG